MILPVYPAGMLVEPFVKQLADALKSFDGRCNHPLRISSK